MAASGKRFNAHEQHVATEATDGLISFINKNDFGWKADTCKLTKGHSLRGAHCDEQPVMLAQVEETKKTFGEDTKEFKEALKKV